MPINHQLRIDDGYLWFLAVGPGQEAAPDPAKAGEACQRNGCNRWIEDWLHPGSMTPGLAGNQGQTGLPSGTSLSQG
jgi:hypothetical protein